MPWGMCPACGTRTLYSLGSTKVWEQKYGDAQLAPKFCATCLIAGPRSAPAPDLSWGDPVAIRTGTSRHWEDLGGLPGEVKWVDSSEDGSIYWVSVVGEYPVPLIRSELLVPLDGSDHAPG